MEEHDVDPKENNGAAKSAERDGSVEQKDQEPRNFQTQISPTRLTRRRVRDGGSGVATGGKGEAGG